MSRYDDGYYRRQGRRSKSGLIFILLFVAFGVYLGFDNGWITADTISNLIPNKHTQLPLCEQSGYAPPCITADGIEVVPDVQPNLEQLMPTAVPVVVSQPAMGSGRPLTFVDGGGYPIVGMQVSLWKDGQEIISETDGSGQVMVYTDGFDPNNRESYVVFAGHSLIIMGRNVIVVND